MCILIVVVIVGWIIIGILLLVLLFSLFTLFATIITWVPFVSTHHAVVKRMVEAINLPRGSKVVDLGAGDGRILQALEKKFDAQGVGYELSPLPWLMSFWKRKRRKMRSKVLFRNFFKEDVHDADLVFCFLTPLIQKKVQQKLHKELKKDAQVVCYGQPFPDWKPSQILAPDPPTGQLSSIYFYKKS